MSIKSARVENFSPLALQRTWFMLTKLKKGRKLHAN
jgi:hypothetical protein